MFRFIILHNEQYGEVRHTNILLTIYAEFYEWNAFKDLFSGDNLKPRLLYISFLSAKGFLPFPYLVWVKVADCSSVKARILQIAVCFFQLKQLYIFTWWNSSTELRSVVFSVMIINKILYKETVVHLFWSLTLNTNISCDFQVPVSSVILLLLSVWCLTV